MSPEEWMASKNKPLMSPEEWIKSKKPEESESNFLAPTISAAKQAGAGLLESVPFYGEKMAKATGVAEPSSLVERTTRRFARNAPYAALAATGVGAIPAAIGLGGATLAGQAAEEVGVPSEYQPLAEIVGGGVPQFAKGFLGRTIGYVEKPLAELTSKAQKAGYEMGPGAKSNLGMKYGSGSDPASAIRNLNKFTEEATARAGRPTTNVNPAWIEQTQAELGNEVGRLFAGKTFTSKPGFLQKIQDVVNKAEGIFGQQGNVARTILEKNIGGKRAGGELLSPQFKAEDLRDAITQVNAALSGVKGPQAKVLHDLKDALEELAAKNLTGAEAKQYEAWRKKYNSWSVIRDVNELEGKTGVTAAGQINPEKLLDEITTRTGGKAANHPLFENLGEFGGILKSKVVQPPGALKAALQSVTESPLSKALQTGLQPNLPGRGAGYKATIQTMAPALQYTQQK